MSRRWLIGQAIGLGVIAIGIWLGWQALKQDGEPTYYLDIAVPQEASQEEALQQASAVVGFRLPDIDASSIGLVLGSVRVPEEPGNQEATQARLTYFESGWEAFPADHPNVHMEVVCMVAASSSPAAPSLESQDEDFFLIGEYATQRERMEFEVPGFTAYRYTDAVRDREFGVGYYLSGNGRIYLIRVSTPGELNQPPSDEEMLPILRSIATTGS